MRSSRPPPYLAPFAADRLYWDNSELVKTQDQDYEKKIYSYLVREGVKNIARIAKRCPEDIASVVKCVKLFLPKVLRKY